MPMKHGGDGWVDSTSLVCQEILNELIFRINVGTLVPSAHVMVRLAARNDDDKAVHVHKLDVKVVITLDLISEVILRYFCVESLLVF